MSRKNDRTRESSENPKRKKPQADKRPVFHTGSTTQGGSNFGQGSSSLGRDSNKQGSTANRGANYENEKWEADDVNTGDDTPPVTNS